MEMSNLLPSFGCIRSYTLINAPIVTAGFSLHLSLLYFPLAFSHGNIVAAFAIEGLIFCMKNFILLFGIGFLTDSRPDIVRREITDGVSQTEASNVSDWITMVSSVLTFTILEALTFNIAKSLGLIVHSDQPNFTSGSRLVLSCLLSYGSFIAVSFVLEVIFDFFHYWSHRFLHEKPALYRSLHSLHHHNSNPTVYHTFNDSVCGTVLTNTIPHLLALSIFMIIFRRPVCHFEHSLLLVYKTFVEVSGHSGKDLGKASSFPQFKWLPVMLGIELYTCDHHSHHRNSKKNFSKRFVLWDKVFGTYLKFSKKTL